MTKQPLRYPTISWIEVVQLAGPVEMGIATSAIKLVYGCGHEVQVMNGDATHTTCPYCYVLRIGVS